MTSITRPEGLPGVPLVSILVPTRNESANIEPLIARIERSTQGLRVEVVFVDDSDDDTAERIARMAKRSSLPVALLARPRGQREGGLGGAVLVGFGLSSGKWICVMDGDLQHPPEVIRDLLAKG